MSLLLSFVCVFAVLGLVFSNESKPWMNTKLPPAERAAYLLQAMELSEKIDMLHGWPTQDYVGYVPPNSRLGIPALTLNDGKLAWCPTFI